MNLRPYFTCLLLWCASAMATLPAAEPPPGWRTGRDLLAQRTQPVTASWSAAPLAEALAELSRSQRMAILLDRRVDPQQPLSLTINGDALEDAVERIARRRDLDVSWLNSLVYVGPEPAARRLRTLAALRTEDAKRLPAERRSLVIHEQSWHWDDLATPRDLCQSLADEARLRPESLDAMPHDLWAAADLPPLTWTERLTFVTNEFDLTFEFSEDGKSVRLVPIVEPVSIERRYSGGRHPAVVAERYARLAPDAEVEVTGGKVIVRGRIEDHERLTAKPKPPPSGKPGKDVYTMRVHNQPLSAVLDKLRGQLGLKLTVDEAALEKAGVRLEQHISFGIEEATLDELLTAILKPVGLTFHGEGKTFEIVPNSQR
ncbi:MAG TPA: hypothetical protein VJ783_03465 [Pirellulales bacterium]|nr:hypothetical protein [Pirellulales bacterium]